MKPTEDQHALLTKTYRCNAAGIHDSIGLVIEKWESIRPKDQITRTNQELARLLAEATRELESKQEALDESITQLNRARGLYRAIIDPIAGFFPDGSRDLDYDVLPSTIYGLAKKAADFDQLLKPEPSTPEPLVFPDPPYGWEWWNPANLTPEQVGIKDGWRLCLGQEQANLPDEEWCSLDYGWKDAGASSRPYSYFRTRTFRTKAPLPAPKPTPEEIEEQEHWAAWMDYSKAHPLTGGRTAFDWAWRAAKKGAASV
jgi:hypothetical protein